MITATANLQGTISVTAQIASTQTTGCAAVTEQVNGTTIGTTASGGTNDQVIESSLGNPVGTAANPSVVSDSPIESSGGNFTDSVESEQTYIIPDVDWTNTDGTPMSTEYGGVITCDAAVTSSLAVAVDDSTIDFASDVEITATPTGLTGSITYTFSVKNYLGFYFDVVQVDDASYTYTCPYAGTFDVKVSAVDSLGVKVFNSAEITVLTYHATCGFTAGWRGEGMTDFVSDRLNSLTDYVSATYTATAPSASERPIARIDSKLDCASTFSVSGNDNRLQTTLTSLASNVMISFCFDFTNNEDQGQFDTLTLLGGDGAANEGARFVIIFKDNSGTRNLFAYVVNGSVATDALITETAALGRNIGVLKYDHATTTLRLIYNGVTTTASNVAGTLWGAGGNYQLLNSRTNTRGFPEPVHEILIKNSATAISDAEQDAAYAGLLLKYPNG